MVLLCDTLKVKTTNFSELTNGGLGASSEVVHLSIHVNIWLEQTVAHIREIKKDNTCSSTLSNVERLCAYDLEKRGGNDEQLLTLISELL